MSAIDEFFSLVRDFFSMGGYAFYVWTAYAVWLVILIANIVLPMRAERATKRRLARQARLESQRT